MLSLAVVNKPNVLNLIHIPNTSPHTVLHYSLTVKEDLDERQVCTL